MAGKALRARGMLLPILGLTAMVSMALAGGCGSDPQATGAAGTGAAGSGGSGVTTSGGVGGAPAGGALVINELMIDPSAVPDTRGEWVELYNGTAADIDLSGYVLDDGGGNNRFVIDSLVVPAGGFVVLGRDANVADNGGAPVDQAYGDAFSLAQGGDTVVLLDAEGGVVDEVSYTDTAPWPAIEPGVSLELSDPAADNGQPQSWRPAVRPFGDGDRGTPGAPNGGGDANATITPMEPWHQPALNAAVYFSPDTNLETHVLAQLSRATQRIRVAMFNLRSQEVKDLLIQKHQAGVDVRVLVDKTQHDLPDNQVDEALIAAGVPTTIIDNDSSTYSTMHNKFVVVDGQRVLTGSVNYTITGFLQSDENLLIVDDAGLAGRYEAEFDEILASGSNQSPGYPSGAEVRAYMGPEDFLLTKVKDAIDASTESVFVAIFHLTRSDIVDALIAARGRGVKVMAIMDDWQQGAASNDSDEDLIAAGVPVILADNQEGLYGKMHHKYVVIDHDEVLFGSYNWTTTGTFDNDENLVWLRDEALATRFEGNFARMVDRYGTQSPGAYGLDTAIQSVTFRVPNVSLGGGTQLVLRTQGGPFDMGLPLDGTEVTAAIAAGTVLDYQYELHENGKLQALETSRHAFVVPYATGPFVVFDPFQD